MGKTKIDLSVHPGPFSFLSLFLSVLLKKELGCSLGKYDVASVRNFWSKVEF